MTHNTESTRYYSAKQEKSIAKVFNGKVSANSGASPFSKNDVNSEHIAFEAKTSMTDKTSFSIKKSMLTKLNEEKFAANKDIGVLAFNFGPSDTAQYYVINEYAMKLLSDYIDTLYIRED